MGFACPPHPPRDTNCKRASGLETQSLEATPRVAATLAHRKRHHRPQPRQAFHKDGAGVSQTHTQDGGWGGREGSTHPLPPAESATSLLRSPARPMGKLSRSPPRHKRGHESLRPLSLPKPSARRRQPPRLHSPQPPLPPGPLSART